LNAVRALNRAEAELRWYPGSPWLSQSLMRAGDRLILAELHPEEAQSLRRTFRGDARVAVHHMDGWTALKAHLPPPERRGLVLVDPPYEAPDEAERLIAGLCTAHRRWPAGILAFWYPIKERPWVWRLWEAVAATGIPHILAVELTVRQELDARRFNGSGMLVVNPPWTLEPTLRGLLPWLHGVLAQDGGGWTLEWLAPETPALAAAPPMSYLPG
jgi:23S rRNA (adenine2030-N6)-methyltransferase